MDDGIFCRKLAEPATGAPKPTFSLSAKSGFVRCVLIYASSRAICGTVWGQLTITVRDRATHILLAP